MTLGKTSHVGMSSSNPNGAPCAGSSHLGRISRRSSSSAHAPKVRKMSEVAPALEGVVPNHCMNSDRSGLRMSAGMAEMGLDARSCSTIVSTDDKEGSLDSIQSLMLRPTSTHLGSFVMETLGLRIPPRHSSFSFDRSSREDSSSGALAPRTRYNWAPRKWADCLKAEGSSAKSGLSSESQLGLELSAEAGSPLRPQTPAAIQDANVSLRKSE